MVPGNITKALGIFLSKRERERERETDRQTELYWEHDAQ